MMESCRNATQGPMPKVIFINRYFYPDHAATSQLLSDLAFHLAAQGLEVRVVTSRQGYDQPGAALPPEDRIEGVGVHRVWTSSFGRQRLIGRALDYLTFYLSATWRLLRLTERGDTLVAKTDPPLISLFAAGVARLRGARLLNWLQDLFPEVGTALGVRMLGGWPGRLLRGLRNASLRQADQNLVLGEGMARQVAAEGIAAERIILIPNWTDGEAIRPLAAADNPLRRDWGLEGRFLVGYSGNLGRAHEYGTLLAAAELLRDDPELLFLFSGGGTLWQPLVQEVARRGLECFRFLPYQPRERLPLSLTLPDLHLVVLRPEFEGLIVPSKLAGVLAAGRPALFIGAEDGEIAGLLRAADAGLAIPCGDGAGLAAALRRLQREPETRARMGENARRLHHERFRSELALGAWTRLLAEGGHHPRGTHSPSQ